ncbi:MAG: sensor histidine kinase [Bacteroidota bacterium]
MKALRTGSNSFLIRLLMIISVAVLTGFSVYWLRGQYLEEKKMLTETLTVEYHSARDQVMDSILLSFYIKPALAESISHIYSGDGTGIKASRIIVNASGMKQNPQDSTFFKFKWDATPEKPLFEVSVPNGKSLPKEPKMKMKTNEMLIRSYQLIMSHSEEGEGGDSVSMVVVSNPEMQGLLEKTFTERLDSQSFPFHTEWQNDSAGEHKHNRIMIPEEDSPGTIQVQVTGINPYLFKKIIPQLIFILFLIGFTSLAFWLAFRTMKKQLLLNLIRKDLISNMTHELKTPVATLKVALEALDHYEARQVPEKAEEYIRIAENEINRLDELIARMLDQVLLEESGAGTGRVRTDLSELVKECISVMAPRAEASGARIALEDNTTQPFVLAEPWYLQSAILNILDNSLKYAGENPEIILRLENRVNGGLCLCVEDNGPGIPKEYSEKIFEKFFRVPSGDVHNVKGHGLGLSLAAAVMKHHRGRIRQENLREGGCRIILEFLPERSDV